MKMDKFSVEILREAKFIGVGLLVSSLVLAPGLIFLKGVITEASESSAAMVDETIRNKREAMQNSLRTELDAVGGRQWISKLADRKVKINRQLAQDNPVEFAILFDRNRIMVDGLKRVGDDGAYRGLTKDEGNNLVLVDSGFFDAVRSGQIISGLLEMDRRLMLTAIGEIDAGTPGKFYLLIARPYHSLRLDDGESKNQADQIGNFPHDSGVKTYRVSDAADMSLELKKNMQVAMQNGGWTFSLNGDGGVVYSVFDDLLKKPVLLVETPWFLPRYLSMSGMYRNFLLAAMFAGVICWWSMRRSDYRSRGRVRRFEGLNGLSMEHLRIFVEAFPGYAFALKPGMSYLAASRILAGVTGHEPSEFFGRVYGQVCSESDEGLLERAFFDLRERGHWPPMCQVTHRISGLGVSHEFLATAHYLRHQDVMLVMLQKKDIMSSTRTLALVGPADKSEDAAA